MPDKIRRTSPSIAARLEQDPAQFQWIQALRLLEHNAAYQFQYAVDAGTQLRPIPLAQFGHPSRESVRIQNKQSLTFSASELDTLKPSNTQQYRVSTKFMGLTGAHGVLPFCFTESVQERQKQKDHTLANFLDLFNHRSLSLFYAASTKYKVSLQYEKEKMFGAGENSSTHDKLSTALAAITGIAGKHLIEDRANEKTSLNRETILYYSGLFSQRIRSASGLKQILKDHFSVDIEVRQFQGEWQNVVQSARARLPSKRQSKGQNVCLGRNTLLGKRGWVAQDKCSIVIKPKTKDIERFSPSSDAINTMQELVKMYLGFDTVFDLKVDISASTDTQSPPLGSKNSSSLSWNCWLGQKPLAGKNENHKPTEMCVNVSANKTKLHH